ncbi:MAG: hypothetical protein GEV06_19680 [Luteitalea sp.]|nr:hypothetical protein [Luteitalea sp.]
MSTQLRQQISFHHAMPVVQHRDGLIWLSQEAGGVDAVFYLSGGARAAAAQARQIAAQLIACAEQAEQLCEVESGARLEAVLQET